MKARGLFTLILVLSWMLAAPTAPARATPPEDITINAELLMTGETSAAGIFWISGLFADNGYEFGDASEVFFIADDTIHGVKTFIGEEGTITIKFQAQLTWTSPTAGYASGQFIILSGTGAYDKLHGVGESFAELNLTTYQIIASYTGRAHFD
jgi:hypothetical protein